MFGVSFLAPLFLLGAAAVAVPIALHLFRRRTDTVIDFPAVRLLRRAPLERQHRRRLRELILLALRIAALVLLAVSFARPYVAGAVAPLSSPLTVVAVDTSLSLSAPGQMDQARQLARRAIESAPASHAVAVVAFDDRATVVVPPTGDRGQATAALDRLSAGAGGTRYRVAFATITGLIGARDGRVVVVTDLQQAGWESTDEGGLPEDVPIEVAPVKAPAGNLAVTAADRRDDAIVATVQNFGYAAVRAPVTLAIDGRVLATSEASVAPQSTTEVRLSASLPAAGAAEVRVVDASGYQGDNVRYVLLESSPAVPIALIVADPAGMTGGLYLERALSVARRGKEFAITVTDGHALSAWPAERLATQAAVVVMGTRTLDRVGRERLSAYLQGGGHVLLTLGPDADLATLPDVAGGELGVVPAPVRAAGVGAALIPTDARHPIFRPFLNPSGALGDVLVEQYRRLSDRPGRTVLARFAGGDTALAEQAAGEGRLLVFTSDLDNQWSRFPLNPAFVPFAIETARYLTAGREQRRVWTLPDVPTGAASAPGIVRATAADGQSVQLHAVNIDPRESAIASTDVDGFTANISRTSRPATRDVRRNVRELEETQRWWQWGLLVMLAALAGEALIGRRAT